MKQQLEIPTDLVRVGHYVSRLDRPWLGTPFLFQGFQVSSEEEVRQLRALCNTVEVSVSGEEADRLLAAGATLRSTVATGAFPALVVPMSGELTNWARSVTFQAEALRRREKLGSTSEVVRLAIREFDFGGYVAASEKHRQVSVRLAPRMKNFLVRTARKKGVSIGELLRAAIEALPVGG